MCRHHCALIALLVAGCAANGTGTGSADPGDVDPVGEPLPGESPMGPDGPAGTPEPGDGPASPGELPDLHVSLGFVHTCARYPTGEAWCWGGNRKGQLGDGDPNEDYPSGPVRFAADDVLEVAAGGVHTCVVTGDESIHCVGANWDGQVGNGTSEDQLTVARVAGMVDARHVATGTAHTCAIDGLGDVWCWGTNGSRQLGNPDTYGAAHDPVPTAVSDALQISAGLSFTCAVVEGGDVYCWGSNCSGQIGAGEIGECFMFSSDEREPTRVVGLDDAVQVDAGDSHACARTANGDVYCWGWNTDGQIGDGGTENVATPFRVTAVSGATDVTAGERHSCAIVGSGDVYCWGGNGDGQLGDGTDLDRAAPVRVEGLPSPAVQIESAKHTCAVTTDGGIWCWGSNVQGQTGNGTTSREPVSTPVHVAGLPDLG